MKFKGHSAMKLTDLQKQSILLYIKERLSEYCFINCFIYLYIDKYIHIKYNSIPKDIIYFLAAPSSEYIEMYHYFKSYFCFHIDKVDFKTLKRNKILDDILC